MNVIAENTRRIRYKGIICDRCGVEVTEKESAKRENGTHCTWLFLLLISGISNRFLTKLDTY